MTDSGKLVPEEGWRVVHLSVDGGPHIEMLIPEDDLLNKPLAETHTFYFAHKRMQMELREAVGAK